METGFPFSNARGNTGDKKSFGHISKRDKISALYLGRHKFLSRSAHLSSSVMDYFCSVLKDTGKIVPYFRKH